MQAGLNGSLCELAASILASQCPFQALGIPANSSFAEAKAAYRRLCLAFHPDKSALPVQRASEVFQGLQAAYAAVGRQLQPVQQAAAHRDLWAEFYAPSAGAPDVSPPVAPSAAAAGTCRPVPNARQGGLWGTGRVTVAPAWGRSTTASASATAAAPAAPVAPPTAAVRKQKDAGHQMDAHASPSRGKARRGVASLSRKQTAPAVDPVAVGDAPEATGRDGSVDMDGGTKRAGRRRRSASGSPGGVHEDPVRPTGAPASAVASGRRSDAWRPGHVRQARVEPAAVSAGGSAPCDEDVDPADGSQGPESSQPPQPQPPRGQVTSGNKNTWARRPVFGPCVRLSSHGPLCGEGQLANEELQEGSLDENEEQGQRRRKRQRSIPEVLAASTRGQARTRRRAGTLETSSSDSGSEGYSVSEEVEEEVEEEGEGEQAQEASSPSSSSRVSGASSSSVSEEDEADVSAGRGRCGAGPLSGGGYSALAFQRAAGASTEAAGRRRHGSGTAFSAASGQRLHGSSFSATLGEGAASPQAGRQAAGRLERPPSSATGVVAIAATLLRARPLQRVSTGNATTDPLSPAEAQGLSPAAGSDQAARPQSHWAFAAPVLHAPALRGLDCSRHVAKGFPGTETVERPAPFAAQQQPQGQPSHVHKEEGRSHDGARARSHQQEDRAAKAEDAAGTSQAAHPAAGDASCREDGGAARDVWRGDESRGDNPVVASEGGADGDTGYEDGYAGGEPDPDDEWWSEPVAPPQEAEGSPAEEAADAPGRQTSGIGMLEAFLQQVRKADDLQAQRAGQARISNLRRNAQRFQGGRRGGGRGRSNGGGGRGRAAAASQKAGGGSSAGAAGKKGGKTMSILQFSRPLSK